MGPGTVKRIGEKHAPWARDHPDALPQYTTNNVIAFLQNPDSAVRSLCLLPEEFCKDVHLQFENSDPNAIVREPAVQIDVHVLRRAIWWYAAHSFQLLEATKEHELFGIDKLGAELEHLLAAYRASLLGKPSGVPSTLSEVATGVSSEQISVQHHGFGAADEASESSTDSEDDPGGGKPVAKKTIKRPRQLDSSMAVSSADGDQVGPLSLWAKAMAKYDILNQLKQQYDAAEQKADEGAKQTALREEAQCLAEAVHALRGLASTETRRTLSQFNEYQAPV